MSRRGKQLQAADLLRLDTPKGRIVYKQQFLRVSVANTLKKMRVEAELTQEQVAERAKMSQPEVSRLERAGGWSAPGLNTVARYADVCGFDLRLVALPRRPRKRRTSITTPLSPPGL